jgi:hypothetical protein
VLGYICLGSVGLGCVDWFGLVWVELGKFRFVWFRLG